MEIKKCTIYLLKNKVNNKIYVGQTWQNLKDRFSNGYGYKHSPHLYSAITKYGKTNFEYIVLAECKTQKEANESEAFFINNLDSRNREKGYNSKEGGSNGRMSEETIIKMRIAHKGRLPSKLCIENSIKSRLGVKASYDTRRKQSIAKLGKPSPNKGKFISEEQKRKISIANTGRVKTKEEIDKIRQAHIGSKRSIEARLNMSKAATGKRASKETRKILSESHKGIKQSIETIRKRIESRRITYLKKLNLIGK